MSDRTLRDEIWESEKFLSLSSDSARLTFIRFVNLCDDFGNFEGGQRRLFRLLARCTQIKSEDIGTGVIEELVSVDLIRRYEVADGEKIREFFHLPKLYTYKSYLSRCCPESPWDTKNVVLGKDKRVTNQGLAKNLTVTSPLRDGDKTTRASRGRVVDVVVVDVVENMITSKEVIVNKPKTLVDLKIPSCPKKKIIELYHERLPLCPKVREWNDTRERLLKSRWKEKAVERGWTSAEPGLEMFGKLFTFISESKFLTGRTKATTDRAPFVATLEWILRPNNWVKIIEGKYHE